MRRHSLVMTCGMWARAAANPLSLEFTLGSSYWQDVDSHKVDLGEHQGWTLHEPGKPDRWH